MGTAESASGDISNTSAATPEGCAGSGNLTQQQLQGRWTLQWLPVGANPQGTALALTLTLSANPDYPDSLIGTLVLGNALHQLAGDFEDDVLTLEESADGTSISANWTGLPVPGSCGREIRGTWRGASDGAQREFVLRRVVGW